MAKETENNVSIELSDDKLEDVAGGSQVVAGRAETIFCPYHHNDCICITYHQHVNLDAGGSFIRNVVHHRCFSSGRDFYGPIHNGTRYLLDDCKIVS